MAKEKKADKASEIKIDDFVGRLRAEITKNYGKDIFLTAKEVIDKPRKIISWSPALDIGLSGGIPTGSWVSVNGKPKTGKAQPLSSTVYTKNGPILMGDIQIGDEVCRPNGGWSMVVDIADQGKKDIYEVCFDDGTSTKCCEDHLWNIKRVGWKKEKVLPLKYLFDKALFNSNGKKDKNKKAVFSIQMASEVDFYNKPLPLHPYLLGLLLGDGCFQPKSVGFTNEDNEIVSKAKELVMLYDCVLKPQSANDVDGIQYRTCGNSPGVNKIVRIIKSLGLENKKSDEKFVPKEYLYCSYLQRLALIQGLMDTDGTVGKKNHCSFSTTSATLAKDFQYLVNSIGGKCVINEKMTQCNDKGFLSFTCSISYTNIKNLFGCSLKKNKCKIRTKKPVRRTIVDIIKKESAKCRCITLDSDDGLYLTDNFIVTHNSTSLLHLAANAQKQGMTVYYLDVECRLKPMNLDGTHGLDQSPEKLVIIKSTPEKILSTQDFLNMATSILTTHHGCFMIIDSISALADEKELEGGIGTETRGHNQKVVTQFIQNIAQLVAVTNSIVCGVTHTIANTSGKGMSPTAEKAATRWIYAADVQMKIKYHDFWKAGGESGKLIGQIVHWEIKTSALGNPYQLADSYLRYGYGIDEVYEIFKYAEICGLISKAGSWYKIDFLEHHLDLLGTTKDKEGVEQPNDIPKFQGGDAVWQYLTENPLIFERLKAEVKNFSGDLSTASDSE